MGGLPISHEMSSDHFWQMTSWGSQFESLQTDDLLAVALPELNHNRQPRHEIYLAVCMWSVKFHRSQCAVQGSSSASYQHILTKYTVFTLIIPLHDWRVKLRKKGGIIREAGILERRNYFFNSLKSSLRIPFQQQRLLNKNQISLHAARLGRLINWQNKTARCGLPTTKLSRDFTQFTPSKRFNRWFANPYKVCQEYQIPFRRSNYECRITGETGCSFNLWKTSGITRERRE